MSYYILTSEIADEDEDSILEGHSEYLQRTSTAFEEGISLAKHIITPVEFKIAFNSLRGTMTDHLSIDVIEGLILSDKVRKIFEQLKLTNCEFFPLHLIDNYYNADEAQMAKLKGKKPEFKTKTYENYFICNIIGLVDAINHQESDLEYFYENRIRQEFLDNEKSTQADESINVNEIDTIIHLKIDEEKIPNNTLIFRLKDAPHIIVVKESLVKEIEETKLTGFVFVPIEKFTEEFIEEDDETDEEDDEMNDQELFVEEKKELPYKTYNGKNYTKNEWEAFEKRQWERFKGKR